MRTTLSLTFCLLFALSPIAVQSAEKDKSKTLDDAARALGGLFGTKKKEPAPADNAAPQSNGSDKTVQEAQQEDREKGTMVGVAAGATLGAVIHEDDRAKGAAVGGTAGGLVGYAVGNDMAKKRGAYAARYDEIDQAILAAQQKIDSLQTDTARVERRIMLREGEIQAATARKTANQSAIVAQQKALAEVEADLKANDTASQSAMVTIKVLEDELKAIEKQVKGDAELASRKTQLEGKRNELLAVLQKINNADNTLVAQRAALNGQARS
jgi:hypothetical protein